MVDENLLSQLYSARLDELREIAISHDMSKAGNVEQLRAKLIATLVLGDIDFSDTGIKNMLNGDLSEVLWRFGIKKSGSKKAKMRRLWLHLNGDPKKLNVATIGEMTREELHALCVSFDLPRSGGKNVLLGRVAGVLSSEEKSWGKVKKKLRQGKSAPVVQTTAVTKEVQTQDDEATELAAMIQASIDAVDVDELTDVLESPDEPGPVDNEGIVESEIIMTAPTDLTIDEGAGSAIIELEARIAELHSHIREFLLISREHDANDVTAFVEDLGGQGFQVSHAMVRNRILAEITAMANRRDAESDASAQVPGSWRERKALRRLEECRPSLLDTLESILDSDADDIALARVRFETAAAEAGLDLDLPGISGRVHGLFDLQLSLREAEEDVDPVTARRQRALEVLYRGTQDVSSDAMRTLQRFEEQIENFERIVETLVRRSEGQFGPVEHALLVRFLERRGWDVGHPEVRPRAIAAAGVLAAAMGYINPEDVPSLPTSISLDPDKVSDVVDSLRDLLVDMGRSAPTADSVAHGVSSDDAEQAEEVSSIGRVRGKLDQADELLSRLSRGFDAEASE